MSTDCTFERFEFQRLGRRRVQASFDGGEISSDGGALLLRQLEGERRIMSRFAQCFIDHRSEPWIEHLVAELFGVLEGPFQGRLEPGIARQPHDVEILGVPGGERRASRASGDLRTAVERAFAAPGPGWSLARHHNPDILVAAAGGELHAAFNTLRLPLYSGHGLAPDDLFDGLAADLPEAGVIPVLPKTWGDFDAQRHLGFPLPATTARLDLGLVPSRDFHLELDGDGSGGPRRHTLAIGDLVVAEAGDDLAVCTEDGRRLFDVVELFAVVLCMQTGLVGTSMTPEGRHAPRITIDRLVVSRETWRCAAAELEFAAAEGEAERFRAARRWAADLDMPRFLFAKVPEEPKPLAVDLDSPLAIEVFARTVRRARTDALEDDVVITEMLPAPDQTWLPDAQGSLYTSELRFVAVDPVGAGR